MPYEEMVNLIFLVDEINLCIIQAYYIMSVSFSNSDKKLFTFVASGIIIISLGFLSIDFISYKVFAQELSNLSSESLSNINQKVDDNTTRQQDDSQDVKASGHFANNQIKDGIVKWIQGGFWSLDVKNQSSKETETSNMTAVFNANFTMIKPNGSLAHNHLIDNFVSDAVIFAGNDIVITGTSDIRSDIGIEYTQVPITVHLMGKKVLGLMIDVNKTGSHFSSDNEIFGTLISGFGLNIDEETGNDTNALNNTARQLSNTVDNNNFTIMHH